MVLRPLNRRCALCDDCWLCANKSTLAYPTQFPVGRLAHAENGVCNQEIRNEFAAQISAILPALRDKAVAFGRRFDKAHTGKRNMRARDPQLICTCHIKDPRTRGGGHLRIDVKTDGDLRERKLDRTDMHDVPKNSSVSLPELSMKPVWPGV